MERPAFGVHVVRLAPWRLPWGMPRNPRGSLNALAPSLVCLFLGWTSASPLVAAAIVLLVFALPGALWKLWRSRSWPDAARILLAWLAAVLPAIVIQQPLL